MLSLVGFVDYLGADPGCIAPARTSPPPRRRGDEAEAGRGHAHGPTGRLERRAFDWVVLGGAAPSADGTSTAAPLTIPLGVHIDNLAVIMFLMVTFIATLIHIYSMGYMHDDPRYPRFFAYLSLFCFSMLGLVASANVFMIFIFWELVGVCSYLLIGFWYEEKKNADAANKAFIVNRVGDVGMLVGLGLLWTSLGTFNIDEINQGAPRRRRASSNVDGVAGGERRSSSCTTGDGAGRDRRGDRPAAADPVLGADPGGAGDLRRLRRQERPVPAPRLAPRRDGRPDAGLGPDPRGDDGRGGRLPGRPVLPAVHRPTSCSTSPTPAGSRCSSRRRSRWCRPTTRRCSPTRRSASSAS